MAKRKFNFKSMKTWKKALVIGLAGLTLVGAIAGLSTLFREDEETTKVIKPKYEIGALTDTGRYLETNESIYTKDAFECQGLDIDLAFDNNISYRVYFYDKDNDFYASTTLLTDNYDEKITPLEAVTARIVITPNDDQKISWYEINNYANQLTINVNKEQKALDIPYKGANKLVYNSGVALSMGTGYEGFKISSGGQFNAISMIDTANCENISIRVSDKEDIKGITMCFLKSGKTDTSSIANLDYEEKVFNGALYLVLRVPSDCLGISMYADSTVDFSNLQVFVW